MGTGRGCRIRTYPGRSDTDGIGNRRIRDARGCPHAWAGRTGHDLAGCRNPADIGGGSMIRHLIDIARLEYVASARLRWIHLLATAYALLALGAAYSAG